MVNKVHNLILAEEQRQLSQINLIASENYTSQAVRNAVGSVLMHKYSEGNVGARFYEGNNYIDELEEYCLSLVAKVFELPNDWGANVQALSGSNANLAVYTALLSPGDTILSMSLSDGGHLSHGYKLNLSGKIYNTVHYGVEHDTELIDYTNLAQLAQKHRPKLIISGGTSYPRLIDHQRIADIAHQAGALYMADVAHEAGLIAGKSIPTPVGIADIVTMTTHKTLRAARGALILANKELIAKVNKAILPGLQGGPFNNNIAGIAVGLEEALAPQFSEYTKNVITNAQKFCTSMVTHGWRAISKGTDKHLFLIDITPTQQGGKLVSKVLSQAGIVLNMNTIPFDTRPPKDPGGIRIGTPMVTSLGIKPEHITLLAELIDATLRIVTNEGEKALNAKSLIDINQQVKEISAHFRAR